MLTKSQFLLVVIQSGYFSYFRLHSKVIVNSKKKINNQSLQQVEDVFSHLYSYDMAFFHYCYNFVSKFNRKKVKNKRLVDFSCKYVKKHIFKGSTSGGEEGTLHTSKFIPFPTTSLLFHNNECYRA